MGSDTADCPVVRDFPESGQTMPVARYSDDVDRSDARLARMSISFFGCSGGSTDDVRLVTREAGIWLSADCASRTRPNTERNSLRLKSFSKDKTTHKRYSVGILTRDSACIRAALL